MKSKIKLNSPKEAKKQTKTQTNAKPKNLNNSAPPAEVKSEKTKKRHLSYLLTFLLGIVLIVGGRAIYTHRTGELESNDILNSGQSGTEDKDIPRSTQIARIVEASTLMQSGNLLDVTKGQTIQDTVFSGTATGTAMAGLDGEGKYIVYSTFDGLPNPAGDSFYEGWVVIPGGSFISTGKLEIVDGKFINLFIKEGDYSQYTRYVLTLEPNDGDPAPAAHILEGDMIFGQ